MSRLATLMKFQNELSQRRSAWTLGTDSVENLPSQKSPCAPLFPQNSKAIVFCVCATGVR